MVSCFHVGDSFVEVRGGLYLGAAYPSYQGACQSTQAVRNACRLQCHLVAGIGVAQISMTEGENPQRVSTEIIIEIKQLNSGRMASHASIESKWCTH